MSLKSALLVLFLVLALISTGCRRRSNAFVIALGDNVRTIDPIGSPSVDAASERVRTLIFNSLVKKNEKFDYVGELASDIKTSADGLGYTFTLHDGVKFHDGRPLTSADVKYTLDLVFASSFAKSASFFDRGWCTKPCVTFEGNGPTMLGLAGCHRESRDLLFRAGSKWQSSCRPGPG